MSSAPASLPEVIASLQAKVAGLPDAEAAADAPGTFELQHKAHVKYFQRCLKVETTHPCPHAHTHAHARTHTSTPLTLTHTHTLSLSLSSTNKMLPSSASSLDPNRMTLVFFSVSGLDLLSALPPPDQRAHIIDWIYNLQVQASAGLFFLTAFLF